MATFRKNQRVVWKPENSLASGVIPYKILHGTVDSQAKDRKLRNSAVWVRFDEEVAPETNITLYLTPISALERQS